MSITAKHPSRPWRARALGMRKQTVLATLALVVATTALGYLYLDTDNPLSGLTRGNNRIVEFEARLDALERRQSEQFNQISRQLAALSMRGSQRKPSPEQIQARERQQAHLRRLQEDPAYARQVQENRLADLLQQFDNEPKDHRWSTEARTLTGEALASAAVQAGMKLRSSEVDCRSTSCRISLEVGAEYVYEDLLTYLMTDLAELLPGAQLVVMPPANGVRKVNIFAHKATTPPVTRPHEEG